MSDYVVEVIYNNQVGIENATGHREAIEIFTSASFGSESGEGGISLAVLNQAIENHKEDEMPHAVYDDMPSLTLVFENNLI